MGRPFKYRGKWCIRFTDEAGKRRKRSYDHFRDADLALAQEKARVKEVKRGLRSPAPPDKFYGQLCDYWRDHRVPQKRSGHHNLSIIKQLRKAFGPMLLSRVGVAEVDRYSL